MLQEFTEWLAEFFRSVFADAWDMLTDLFVFFFDMLLGVWVYLIGLIPIPEFLQQGMQTLYTGLDPGIAFFLSGLGLPEVMTMIGGAYLFRITRKALTLFQW